jgi:hypothetical protein
MFRENGLVGLRNILGEILVPCGEYNYIKGCEYGNDTTLAVAAKDGKFGLIKRDGKGTVVVPFNYYYIEELTYDWFRAYPDDYDIFYGEWEDTSKGKDLIVNGQVVILNDRNAREPLCGLPDDGEPFLHVEEAALVLVDAHSDDHFVEHRERAFEDIQMAGRERVERTGKQGFRFHNCQLIGVFPSA